MYFFVGFNSDFLKHVISYEPKRTGISWLNDQIFGFGNCFSFCLELKSSYLAHFEVFSMVL